jgi:biotin carboxyl carrier protein
MAQLIMKHRLLLDGAPYDVWLVERGGRRVLFDGDGAYDLEPVPTAVVATDGDVAHVHLDGRVHVVEFQSAVEAHSEAGSNVSERQHRAPMPGAVVSVAVQVGDAVRASDTLMVIESMKLETAIKAGRDGTVETVHVGPGQTFERDALLISLTALVEA